MRFPSTTAQTMASPRLVYLKGADVRFSANDEPEFSESELLSADVSLSASKSERNDHEAFVNQVRMNWEM